jgi:hypothetical protein
MTPEILIAEKGLVGVDYTRYSIAPCCLRLRVLMTQAKRVLASEG